MTFTVTVGFVIIYRLYSHRRPRDIGYFLLSSIELQKHAVNTRGRQYLSTHDIVVRITFSPVPRSSVNHSLLPTESLIFTMKFPSLLFLACLTGKIAAKKDFPPRLKSGKREATFDVQYLSGPDRIVPCENEGELVCATGVLEGDWEGSAKVRFDNFVIDSTTGAGSYSGEIDICVTAVQNRPRKGCVTGTVTNGTLQIIGFTDSSEPIFSVSSEFSATCGTGYFKKRTCTSTNTGTIDPSRTPFGEVLDFAITCS